MRNKRNVRSFNKVCVVIEKLKTEHMSIKNVNKNETEHKATHVGTQLNAKKLMYRNLH